MSEQEPKSVGLSIRELTRMWPRLSEEEWRARELELGRERAAMIEPIEKRTTAAMLERGWPQHVIDGALVADPRHEAISELRALSSRERTMVVLSGAAGCGKTVAAARWSIDDGRCAHFVRASTFARASRYKEDGVGSWIDHPALVFDDLGAEYLDAKGSFLVDLDELIDTYYGSTRPLLITTNCGPRAFADRYGERIVDRLRECAIWISIRQGSMRQGER